MFVSYGKRKYLNFLGNAQQMEMQGSSKNSKIFLISLQTNITFSVGFVIFDHANGLPFS